MLIVLIINCQSCINNPWIFSWFQVINSKELYTGTPNSDIRILFIVLCGRNVNKPSSPTRVEGKGLKLWCDITVQQKTSLYIKLKRILIIFGFLINMENKIAIYSYSTPWPISLKNDALPLNSLFWSSTQIWHIRYGDSWSIHFLINSMFKIHVELRRMWGECIKNNMFKYLE